MKAPVLGYLATTALATFGLGIATPSIALRLAEAGVGGGLLGLVLSAYNLGVIGVGLLGSRLLRRLGARQSLRLAGTLLGVALAIQVFTSELAVVALARALAGAGFSFGCLAVETGIGRAAGARRGLFLGIYLAVANGAQCAGTLLASPEPTVLVLAVVAVLGTWASARSVETEAGGDASSAEPTGPAPLDFGLLVRRAPGAAIAATCGGAAVSALTSVAPIYGAKLGLSGNAVVLLLTSVVATGAVLPPLLGITADRRGYDRVIRGTVIMVTGVALLSALLGEGLAAMATLCMASGLAFALYPLGVGLAQVRLSDSELPRVTGGLLILFATAAVAGGPAAGAMVERLGAPALPLWVALATSSAVLGPVVRNLTAARRAEALRPRTVG